MVPVAAYAQSVAPSQVIPPTLVPPQPQSAPGVTPVAPSPSPSPPASVAQMRIHLSRIEIRGGLPAMQAETRKLVAPLEGKTVSVAQIYQLVTAIEQAYARAGYILARVTVPPQRVQEAGVLRLDVVDGYIEKVDAKGVAPSIRDAFTARVQDLVGRRDVTLEQIERALMIAGGLPGVKLQSALTRGEQEGGTQLVLSGDRHLVSGSFGVNNNLPSSLGGWQSWLSLSLNDALDLGEQAYVLLGTGLDLARFGFPQAPLHDYGGGVVVPIGVDGFTVNPEYIDATTRIAASPGVPDTTGGYKRFALRANYPLLTDHFRTVNVTGEVNAIDQRIYGTSFKSDLSHDDYWAGRLGLNWHSAAYGHVPEIYADMLFSRGLGGRSAGEAGAIPLSRQGATPEFSKLEADFRMTEAFEGPLSSILGPMTVSAIGRGQTSFGHALFTSEQFGLDGAGGLSTATAGTLSVDAGETLRGKIGYAMPFSPFSGRYGAGTLSPYLFGAQGLGWLYEPTAVERHQIRAGAFGGGVRLGWAHGSFGYDSIGVEVGRLSSDLPGSHDTTRVAVTASVNF